MTSLFDIVSPPRIRGEIRQVSGWTTAGPRRDKRWDIERTGERIREGLRKIVRGVERAGEKPAGLFGLPRTFPLLLWDKTTSRR